MNTSLFDPKKQIGHSKNIIRCFRRPNQKNPNQNLLVPQLALQLPE
jgi:hypothetical protein